MYVYIQSYNSKGFAPWNLMHKIPVFLDPGGFVKFEPQARTLGKCWESFNCLLLIVDLENVELFFTLGHPAGSGRRGCVASLRCAGPTLMMWFAVTRSPRPGALKPPRLSHFALIWMGRTALKESIFKWASTSTWMDPRFTDRAFQSVYRTRASRIHGFSIFTGTCKRPPFCRRDGFSPVEIRDHASVDWFSKLSVEKGPHRSLAEVRWDFLNLSTL